LAGRGFRSSLPILLVVSRHQETGVKGSAMSVTRLVVVGPGLMGMKHIDLVHADPRTELAAIVQPEPIHARHLSESLGVPVFPDIGTCLEAVRPDGVILASPNPFHFEQARICAAAGTPMLIEKPITDDLSEAEALVDLIARSGVMAMVGHHRAHSPLVHAALRVVQSGRLGRLVAFQGSAVFRKPDDYFAAAPWRTQSGGGPILINLIHEIGMMRTLCGEIDAVQAQTSSRVRGHAVEDTAAITVSFSGGALGVFMLSDSGASARSWEQTTGENPAFFNAPEETCYTLTGEKGTLHFPTLRLETFADAGEASWMRPFSTEAVPVERHDPLAAQLTNFIDVIRGEGEVVVTPLDGLRNLRVIDAIRRSAESGQMVRIAG
jgi:predicted dehydrogenase